MTTPRIVAAMRQRAADVADTMTLRAVEIEQAADRNDRDAGDREIMISAWMRFLAAWVRLGAEVVRLAA